MKKKPGKVRLSWREPGERHAASVLDMQDVCFFHHDVRCRMLQCNLVYD